MPTEDSDVMIISSGKQEEEEEAGHVGGSEDVPVIIVDEGEEEEEIHGEDSEVIGAFSGEWLHTITCMYTPTNI